jgi:hypothetical protein
MQHLAKPFRKGLNHTECPWCHSVPANRASEMAIHGNGLIKEMKMLKPLLNPIILAHYPRGDKLHKEVNNSQYSNTI